MMHRVAPPRSRAAASSSFHVQANPGVSRAVVIALLLPFPGPHIDSYIPIAAVLFRRDALQADSGFFVLIAVLLIVYTAVAFGAVTLVRWLARKARGRRGV